jgi:hypothetical protein
MNTNATTKNSDMKISYRRSNDTRHSKPLFVTVSKFDTDGFPVRVRCLRLGQTHVLKTSSGISRLERQGIPQRQRQGKMNPIDVVSKSLNIARRIPGHISTFL